MIKERQKIFLLAIIATLIVNSASETTYTSTCPRPKPMANFRPYDIVGNWYMTNKLVTFETKYKVTSKVCDVTI